MSFSRGLIHVLLCVLAVLRISPAVSQDSSILHSISEIEHKLQYESFEMIRIRDARFEGDITKRAIVQWPDGKYTQVKWKKAPRDGAGVNNEPRYEVAAYRLQKLFLEPEQYVVPPTVIRTLPVQEYCRIATDARETFEDTECVIFCLQYWLENVTSEGIYDKSRFESDTTYARHLANMNVLSYLVKHKDANVGNFLISTHPTNPRLFVVDNSMAFSSLESDKGIDWQRIRVKRLPRGTVDKLRKIRRQDLEEALGVVAQFEVVDGVLLPTETGSNLGTKKGVRRLNGVVQFGLRQHEISAVYKRLQKLLTRVDKGKIKLF